MQNVSSHYKRGREHIFDVFWDEQWNFSCCYLVSRLASFEGRVSWRRLADGLYPRLPPSCCLLFIKTLFLLLPRVLDECSGDRRKERFVFIVGSLRFPLFLKRCLSRWCLADKDRIKGEESCVLRADCLVSFFIASGFVDRRASESHGDLRFFPKKAYGFWCLCVWRKHWE